MGHTLWVGYSEEKAAAKLRAAELAIHDQLWYAHLLYMVAVANPEISAIGYERDIRDNPGLYTHIEFVMNHPPLDEREPGTLYLAPEKYEVTQKRLDRLNTLIANDPSLAAGENLGNPLTFEDAVNDYEGIKTVFNRMNAAQLFYFYYTSAEPPLVPGTSGGSVALQPEEG
ncbi:MAG: hypothetical protein LBP24_00585 [Coriobacteriales bacterium]|nr:hypothetical protein [Coriobacteriales bacterium]